MLVFLVTLLSSFSQAIMPYPTSPDPRLTVGSLCDRPVELRYPERIKYCGRDVSAQEKEMVIQVYEKTAGYRIYQTGRQRFKIDHYVPLCMGGSNNINNLWPQHESIYVYTDPLEALGCQKLSLGRVRQAVVIDMLFQAKRNPALSQRIFQAMNSL